MKDLLLFIIFVLLFGWWAIPLFIIFAVVVIALSSDLSSK